FLSWIFSLFGELNKFRRLQNHYHIDGNWILTLDHKFNQFGITARSQSPHHRHPTLDAGTANRPHD
ncbi:hypothetical protein, partial [Pseudoalteromonas sp. PPB1]|uniref:hypothetical protein n=1 Tax=Pseudoalteromonas sp. PPB1 TaxID=2756136 RepID=UPI001E41D553